MATAQPANYPAPAPQNIKGFGGALLGDPIQYQGAQYTPLYDQTSGQFIGWQDAQGKGYRAAGPQGLAPSTYQPSGGWNAQQQQAAAQAAAAQAAGGGYYGTTGGGGGSGVAAGGGVPAGGGGTMATTSASQFPMAMFQGGYTPSSADIGEWQKWYGANQGKTVLVNGQAKTIGQDIQPGDLYNAFQGGQVGFGQYQQQGPQISSQNIGQTTQQPETVALQQLAQIDPTTEALRQGLAQSYLTQLQGGGQPTNQQLQGYLQQFQQIDPSTYAAMMGMGGQYQNLINQQQAASAQAQGYLPQYQNLVNQAQANLAPYQQDVTRMNQLAALGTQLDPETLREITQATRQGQQARGNIYGTPQLVEEAMTRGQAGMQIQQQREQMLQAALGSQQGGMSSYYGALGQQQAGYGQYLNSLQNQQGGLGAYQGYLTSGATPGGLALNLYNQQMGNIRANQQAALGYLGSGSTPYQAASQYINQAQQNAANAASSTAYNAQGPSSYYTGAGTSSFPQYGLDTSQNALGYYSGMNTAQTQNYYAQQYGQQANKQNYGAIGSAAGGVLGATVGSIIPGVGTAIGGLAGSALGGAAGSYFS